MATAVQGRCAQNFELEGRLDRTALPRVLNAIAVGLECRLGGRRQALELLLGHADDAQSTHQLVGVQGGFAQNFGQLTAHDTSVERHLPAALLGMDKADGSPSVQGVAGVDVGHIRSIPGNLNRAGQAFELNLAIELGHTAQQMHAHGPTCGQKSGHSR